MELPVLLFILRLLSALLLLAFLGLIAWLIHQDLKATAAAAASQNRQHGLLRIMANEADAGSIGMTFPLLPVTSIGRSSSNNVVLDDSYASGEHALITRRGEHWWVEDLGSRNGMLLNDIPLQGAAVVTAGDVLTIGGTKLKIEI